MRLLHVSLLSIILLPLSLNATNVQYSVFTGTDPAKNVITSFVSSDFLTNLPSTTVFNWGTSPAWVVPMSEVLTAPSECQHGTCEAVRFIDGGLQGTFVSIPYYYIDGHTRIDRDAIAQFIPYGLGQIGIGGYPNGGLSLAVQYTDHVATYDPVPEPGTFALAGLAFCFFAPTIVGAVRRRFNSTSHAGLAASRAR